MTLPVAALALLWGALVSIAAVVDPSTTTCTFRRLTGVPCATCGSTRAVLAFARADPLAAFALNPMMASLLIAAPIWLGLRLLRPRADEPTRPALSRRARALLWVLGTTVFVTNWVYVIWHEGHH